MAREVTEVIVPVDLDAIPDGTTYKKMTDTELTKLTNIADGAEVNPANLAALDSTQDTKLNGIDGGAEVNLTALQTQSGIVGLADSDRVLVGSEPLTGEKKVYGVHLNAAGNIELDNESVPEA